MNKAKLVKIPGWVVSDNDWEIEKLKNYYQTNDIVQLDGYFYLEYKPKAERSEIPKWKEIENDN